MAKTTIYAHEEIKIDVGTDNKTEIKTLPVGAVLGTLEELTLQQLVTLASLGKAADHEPEGTPAEPASDAAAPVKTVTPPTAGAPSEASSLKTVFGGAKPAKAEAMKSDAPKSDSPKA